MSDDVDPNGSVELFPEMDADTSNHALRMLEVFNWGPFTGMHRAEFDGNGTAIIGPTGSGKTTLIDALMTLLVHQPKYNLASTGGHESDRTLISYVRGALGGGAEFHEEYSRPGKTISGICATYENEGGGIVLQGALLWTDGGGCAAEDLKRRWVFSRADGESLEGWLQLLSDGGARALMRHGRETGLLRIFESKKTYLAHTRKYFDVGENAFTLLNRAAGLKQINSIDEIFRDLVLDDRSQFDRALEVAGDFDNLVAIHSEMQTAKQQAESLRPIAVGAEKLTKVREREARYKVLKSIMPIWFASVGVRMWTHAIEEKGLALKADEVRLANERAAENKLQHLCDTLREKYLELGGGRIGELEKSITEQEGRVEERRKSSDDYLRIIRQFTLNEDLRPEALQKNQGLLSQRKPVLEKDAERRRQEYAEAFTRGREGTKRLEEIEKALDKARRRPGSNIPVNFQEFRDMLAEQLGVEDSELPFLAELVEVKAEERQWRGAIERALGSERLRIMVSDQYIQRALEWVNHRDNRLHVRLLRTGAVNRRTEFFTDGFLTKLNFKQHDLREVAMAYLSGKDRHCVSNTEALREIEFGMTIQGMMSGRHGRFEKQDQRSLNQDWMTGFDNKEQLKKLTEERDQVRSEAQQWTETAKLHLSKEKVVSGKLVLIDKVIDLDFLTIDLPKAEEDLTASKERLRALQDPQTDVGAAKAEFDEKGVELEILRKCIRGLDVQMEVCRNDIQRIEKVRSGYLETYGDGLNPEENTLAETEFSGTDIPTANDITSAERTARESIEQQLEKSHMRIEEIEKSLIRAMGAAKNVDTGALAETGTECRDIPDYLERLKVLEDEALPEKITRFRDYLNRSSDQGVTQLLSSIDEEVDDIEQRIKQLNVTLSKVEYRSGRFLQLLPGKLGNERLRSLHQASRHLRTVAMEDEEGERHFKALESIIRILREAAENRRQVGSLALLDPRYRLEFRVIEVDWETGERSAPRSGSQSGSGGEKELMASHILTASLSYALCPVGADRPLYGTVVLDEAFSKSSPSAAGRIIHALRTFGLHPVFVTPNKEIGLLKKHTRKVICVHRKGKEASLASISWERLEDLARER